MPKSRKDYEALGRLLVEVSETGYTGRLRMYKASFIKGVFSGFGGVIGATLMVALLLWILSLLDNIPLVGRLVDVVTHTVDSRR